MKYSSITLSSVKLSSETDKEFETRIRAIDQIKRLVKNKGVMPSLLPLILAACGGSSSSPAPSTPPPPPPPEPDYTENPTGTFTGRDNSDLTLSQGSATTDLIVNSKDGNDTITTGSGNDIINGAGGNDTISSRAGNDQIEGGTGADTISAGDGNDMIWGGQGADIIDGGAGDDIIIVIGTTGANDYADASITNPGGSGLDLSSMLSLEDVNGQTVSEGEAGETIDGGTGNDTLVIYGTVDLTGITLSNITTLQVNSTITLTPEQLAQFTTVNGDGSSVIHIVDDPDDDVTYEINLSIIDLNNVALITTTGDVKLSISNLDDIAGIAAIEGDGNLVLNIIDNGTGTTSITISDLASKISGLKGIEVEDATTLIIDSTTSLLDLGVSNLGGAGTITVSDTAPSAVLLGNAGGGEIIGTVDADIIFGLHGDDWLYGEAGNDYIVGGGAQDWLYGGIGDDTLLGGDGYDVLIGGHGADYMDGGGGRDSTGYINSPNGVTINLAEGTASGGFAEGDTLVNIERVSGSYHSDHLVGDDLENRLSGAAGNDIIYGGGGNDILDTGPGSDQLYGQNGDDLLIVYGTNNYINGGDGFDRIWYPYNQTGIVIDLEAGTISGGDAGTDEFHNIEAVSATDFDDILRGDDEDNAFTGGEGNNLYEGRGGADAFLGSTYDETKPGFDTVSYESSPGAVYVFLSNNSHPANPATGGDAQGDVLYYIDGLIGSDFNDVLWGTDYTQNPSGDTSMILSNGKNVLDGGAGNDELNGLGADDTLVGGAGNDTLTGGTGADIFVFDGTFGNDTITDFEDGLDLLDFSNSTLAFTDLTITQNGSDTLIEDGSGNSITLTGITSTDITADDFIF